VGQFKAKPLANKGDSVRKIDWELISIRKLTLVWLRLRAPGREWLG